MRRIALSKTSSNIKVYNAEIRQHQCELIRQVNTRGILCEQANSKPHHYPSAIADLISGCPSKYPACSALSQPHVIGHRRIHIYHGLFYRATEISTTASEQYLHRTQYISCGYFSTHHRRTHCDFCIASASAWDLKYATRSLACAL